MGKMLKLLKGKSELINKHAKSWEQPIHKGLLQLHVLNKLLSLKLLSLFKKDNSKPLKSGKIVYQQRNEWLKGYR